MNSTLTPEVCSQLMNRIYKIFQNLPCGSPHAVSVVIFLLRLSSTSHMRLCVSRMSPAKVPGGKFDDDATLMVLIAE